MCGIAGFIVKRGTAGVEAAVSRMVDSLNHRGPDSQGFEVRHAGEWTIALGHTRLAILDLSAEGHQPMQGARPGTAITYNGEVYNFQQLRGDLEKRGCRFTSNCDTEVIVKGFEERGAAWLGTLRGMFAFGIVDERTGQLLLMRDPLGIKPLYTYQGDGVFAFASEVRALFAAGWTPKRLDPEGVENYLEFGSVHAPLTMIAGVRLLLPGEQVSVEMRGRGLEVARRPAANEAFTPPCQKADAGEAAAEVRRVLEESVRLHLISDVPLGLFLSGGIDSSAMVALAAHHAPGRVKTFSIGFPEEEFNEQSYAKLIAGMYGTDHREIEVTEESLLKQMPAALAAMDQPSADGINTYVISKAVKDAGVTVAISGLGGDELFAGYSSFHRAARWRSLGMTPRALRRAVAWAGERVMNGSVARTKLWSILASPGTPADICRSYRQMFVAAEIEELTQRSPSLDLFPQWADWNDPVNSVSRCELQGYMANTLLRDSDVMSMAHALEIRVPFVDVEVVKTVLSFPGGMKLDGQRPKSLLLDALGPMIPAAIWQRKKMGFTFPFRKWMLSALKDDIDRVLARGGPLAKVGLNMKKVDEVWGGFQRSQEKERWPRTWTLYVLGRWCEENGVSA